MVIRPWLLRPPVFFKVVTKDFSGLDSVMSSNPGESLWRVPGVTGLSFFNAMTGIYRVNRIIGTIILNVTIKINYFALGQRNDGFLVIRFPAGQYAGLCVTRFVLAHHSDGIDAPHIHTVLFFDGLLDLHFVGPCVDNKSILALFIQGRYFLSNQG